MPRYSHWTRPARLLAIGAALVAGPAHALISIDSDPVYGPNSIIRDVDHHREFLRLDLTESHSYLDMLEATAPGGAFEGWAVASLAELFDLRDAALLMDGATAPDQLSRAAVLRDWFSPEGGCTFEVPQFWAAYGLTTDEREPGQRKWVMIGLGPADDIYRGAVAFRVGGSIEDDNRNFCTFLVRDPVVPLLETSWTHVKASYR